MNNDLDIFLFTDWYNDLAPDYQNQVASAVRSAYFKREAVDATTMLIAKLAIKLNSYETAAKNDKQVFTDQQWLAIKKIIDDQINEHSFVTANEVATIVYRLFQSMLGSMQNVVTAKEPVRVFINENKERTK